MVGIAGDLEICSKTSQFLFLRLTLIQKVTENEARQNNLSPIL